MTAATRTTTRAGCRADGRACCRSREGASRIDGWPSRPILVARVVVAAVVGLELQRERREVVEAVHHVGTSSPAFASPRTVSRSRTNAIPAAIAPPTAVSPAPTEPPTAKTAPNVASAA